MIWITGLHYAPIICFAIRTDSFQPWRVAA